MPRRSRVWVGHLVVAAALVFGVLFGPQCADGMAGEHGMASAAAPPQNQHVVLTKDPVALGVVMPVGELPLGGVLAVCVTLLVAVLLTAAGQRPGPAVLPEPRRPSRPIRIVPALSASAPSMARLCVLRT